MIKNKNILISIILLIIGAGIFVFINQSRESQTLTPQIPWAKLRKDMLTEISVTLYTQKSPVQYSIKRAQGAWRVAYPISIQALPEKAIHLANTFLNLYPDQKLTNLSQEEFISYGLTKPVLRVQGILKNKKTNCFIVGKKTNIGNRYYIAVNNKTNFAYLIQNTYLEPFIQGISGIINNYLVTQPINNIINIKFINFRKQEMHFNSSNQFWIQTKPYQNKKVDWGVRQFLLRAKNLNFDPHTLHFTINQKILSKFNINTNSSPQLKLRFNDGTGSQFFIGSIQSNNTYPIYNSTQDLIGSGDKNTIEDIFNTSIQDFTINKNE